MDMDIENKTESTESTEFQIGHYTALVLAYRTIGVSVDMKDAMLIEKISDFIKGKTTKDIKLHDIDNLIKESNHDFENIVVKNKLV